MGSPPALSESEAGMSLPYTRVAALAVEHLARREVALGRGDAVAAEAGGAPVASPRRPTLATLMPSSRPIRWKGLYIAAYWPVGSVTQAVLLEAAARRSRAAAKTT